MRVDRREFLTRGLGAFGLATAPKLLAPTEPSVDQTFGIELDKYTDRLSGVECRALAERLDRVYDALGAPDIPATPENMDDLVREVVPFFEIEGFVNRARYPEDSDFWAYTPRQHDGVLGTSNCDSYIRLNERMENPMSSWHNDDDFFTTIVHELAHVQQTPNVCQVESNTFVESTAQIMTLEVLAALTNTGNEQAFRSLVQELRGMAMGGAYMHAIRNDHIEEYSNWRSRLSPGAFSEARFERSRRRWEGDPATLIYILTAYDYTPLNRAATAIQESGGFITDLALPRLPNTHIVYEPQSEDDLTHPVMVQLNDLRYVIEHAEDLAGIAR